MFELKSAISKSSTVNEEDVKNTKSVLRDFGLYPKDKGIESFTDNELFDGIEKFQKTAGLKVDGVMRPKGETETRTNQVMDNMKTPPKPQENPDVKRKPKPPVPEKKPVRDCSALKAALDNARRDMRVKDAILRNANKELQALKQKRDALKTEIEKETDQRNKAVFKGILKGGYRGGRMGSLIGPLATAAGTVAGGTIGGTLGYGVEELVDVLSGDGTLGTVEESYQKVVSDIGNLSVAISKLYVPELRATQERVKKSNEAYRVCKNHNG
ncbi:MAG: hypothetical protein COB76_03170 [Alphaproteobacteria bacterium]|nr:MAG: hypothetical protein COB76_03170 [Alphaproteobacteria bacterium]